ncbi:MAG: 5'-nucleotidase C-terminal domain-containing protein [Clostridia bacterium]
MDRNLKKLTLLHSNDMHGDFMAENIDKKLIGGVSMLSGYVDQVRQQEKNTIYAIAGDMFRGSVIDSEYKGISTIEIMNLISPDIVTIGNHEADYGIAHLLFIEKCAKFPIINANLYIKTNHARLFKPYHIIDIDGMKILFIGILTEEIIAQTKQDSLIGSIIDVYEAAEEVGHICNSYNNVDIDMTVLLTHIGFEEDKKLATLLDPDWGVDMIIGGHTHTLLDQPVQVNNILIVQVGTGTDQIGRFDIEIDTDNNCIDSWKWRAVPIDSSNCPVDHDLENLILSFKKETDKKYTRIITRFARKLTHPARNMETELGDLCADILKDCLGLDIMMFASGSIRSKALGPIVRYQDFTECFPYDDAIHRLKVTGKQLRLMIGTIFSRDFMTGHTEFYQFSHGLHVKYSLSGKTVTEITFENEPLDEKRIYSIGLQNYHFNSIDDFMGISKRDAEANAPIKTVSTSCCDVLMEAFTVNSRLDRKVENRIQFIE